MTDRPILDEQSLPAYLAACGIAPEGGPIAVEPAGDGNINWVRRVRLPDGSSWIVKQARPALERFPEYRVSTERIVFEARYMEAVRPWDTEHVLPHVRCFDSEARVLVLEDLGSAPRLDHALVEGADGSEAAARIGAFLGRVHGATAGRSELAARFANDEMRRLHGDHIFALPFARNEFPLPQRVAAAARMVWQDPVLPDVAAAAYRQYLEADGALVHGDVQAGNVLLTPEGAKLLDAEIAHMGDPAFDLGTLLAHLMLPAMADGVPARARPAVDAAWDAYRSARPETPPQLFEDAARYAAIEMMRRTIGAARVPIVESEEASLNVIGWAVDWMRKAPADPERLGG